MPRTRIRTDSETRAPGRRKRTGADPRDILAMLPDSMAPALPTGGPARATETTEDAQAFSSRPAPPPPGHTGPQPERGQEPTEKALIVTLRTERADEVTLPCGDALQKAAMEWSHKVRNRRRWAEQEEMRETQAEHCLAAFAQLGVSREDLQKLARAHLIEVQIPYVAEHQGWEARIFPWEYMLTAATHSFRNVEANSITVLRHLDRRTNTPLASPRKPTRALIVESAPGRVRELFNFISEVNLVKNNLGVDNPRVSIDATGEELTAQIQRQQPDVIHLAGIDSHQATSLGILPERSEARDGYLLRDVEHAVVCADAEQLARIVSAAQRKPLLVSCNIYNSAARLCALMVAEGAGAAIGFQDEFEDRLTELFFTNFYLAWRLTDWNLLHAFQFACEALRKEPRGLVGTGMVLWSERSLLQPLSSPETVNEPRKRRGAVSSVTETTEDRSSPSLQQRVRDEKRKPIMQLTDIKDASALSGILELEIIPHRQLNYSMLHNDRGLFQKFSLTKLQPGLLTGVHIEVKLYVGSTEGFGYDAQFNLEESKDLCDTIRIPLMYLAGNSLQERVHASLYVRVTWEPEGRTSLELYRDTHRVTLLPLDEWRDDDTDRVWLPSFVLPRDPAVGHIIDAAQRYLMALLDDSNAGFDGYQSTTGDEELTDSVDLQVQAIWSSLLYERTLNYINPPPTYTSRSQRIRTPSDILHGKRGTCIDLALLLASCLEYIEIYPVIILLKGHAFPCYWRRYAAHRTFIEGALPANTASVVEAASGSTGGSGAKKPAWYVSPQTDSKSYEMVVQWVRNRDIVPIETVWLTQHGSFYGAIEEGVKNLRNKQDFDAFIDVTLARRHGVTPIPLGVAGNGAGR